MGPFLVTENHGHTPDIDMNGIPECIAFDLVRPATGKVQHQESDTPDTDSIKDGIGKPVQHKNVS